MRRPYESSYHNPHEVLKLRTFLIISHKKTVVGQISHLSSCCPATSIVFVHRPAGPALTGNERHDPACFGLSEVSKETSPSVITRCQEGWKGAATGYSRQKHHQPLQRKAQYIDNSRFMSFRFCVFRPLGLEHKHNLLRDR